MTSACLFRYQIDPFLREERSFPEAVEAAP